MLDRKIPFPRDLFWIFPHDEEINGWAAQASVKVFREKFGIGTKGFDFIIDEGTPPVRGVIPFNDEHFMMIGYSAKGGVNVELKVDFDKAGHGSIPARESAITILTKGISLFDKNRIGEASPGALEIKFVPFLLQNWTF